MIRTSQIGLALVLLGFASSGFATEPRPNVLFIVLDDLNDWVGFLGGHPNVQTPHMDALAKRGVVFTNAYCVSPICGPSRAAVLTGLRPESTGAYTNAGNYRTYMPEAVTFPEVFRQHGYTTLAAGKVNHDLGVPDPLLWDQNGPDCGVLGTPFQRDELKTLPVGQTRVIHRDGLQVTLPANGGLSAIDRPTMKMNSFDWAPLDVQDNEFPDGKIAAWGAEQLLQVHDQPFFLALGFYKPHQPLFAPQRYFDLYDGESVALPRTIAGDLFDVPLPGIELAHRPWTSGTHRTVVKHNAWRQGVHAYLATVSFADAQVGRLLDALDRGAYAENTWVVLWSDHGWSLGSKEHWGKHAPWQENCRVPLVIVPPKHGAPSGFRPNTQCDIPVSLLDLYPTLLAMCGLPSRSELEGTSLLPLLADPTGSQIEDAEQKAVVITIGRGTHRVTTKRWHYLRYFDGSVEFYDRNADPHEWFNLANDPDYEEIMHNLAARTPQNERIQQFVRFGSYKCVIPREGEPELYDLEEVFGISERNDLAAKRPAVVASIAAYLRNNNLTDRRVTIRPHQSAIEKQNLETKQ